MGWGRRDIKGVRTITGAIGDPLAIHVTARFNRAWDFTGHTWLCQVRRTVPGALVAELVLLDDSTTVTPPDPDIDGDLGSALIDLTFGLTDTKGTANAPKFLDSEPCVYGVKAIEGGLAPYTLIRARPIIGYDVVPRVEPPS